MIPDNWEVDKWMYYAEIHGWAVKDSFKEAKKGAAQGKLAGTMNSSADTINLELGNYIQQHVMMLAFIETQLGKIAGVSDQRQGQIENRELVGNVERSVTQSSHITEKWFALHGSVKVRAMNLLLETAKHAWRKETNKQVQYVLDDMSTAMIRIDGEQINDADYGVMITDASSDTEIFNAIKGLAQAGLQNDKINFSTIIDIYMTPSMSAVRRKIESAEATKIQQVQEAQQHEQDLQQQQIQANAQTQQDQRDFELLKIDKEHENAMALELLKAKVLLEKQSKDLDYDGTPDVVEFEKIQKEERVKQSELASKEKLETAKLKQEAAENEKDRKNKLEIERLKVKNKPKPAMAR